MLDFANGVTAPLTSPLTACFRLRRLVQNIKEPHWLQADSAVITA
jgi:hypothetical protein